MTWPKKAEDGTLPQSDFATAVSKVVAFSFVLEFDDSALDSLLETLNEEVEDAVDAVDKAAADNNGYPGDPTTTLMFYPI